MQDNDPHLNPDKTAQTWFFWIMIGVVIYSTVAYFATN